MRESHADRDRRQEQTKFELETKVLPVVNEQRVTSREAALSEAEEDAVVELILSAMFLLPRLYGILAGEPLAEDVLVFPGQPVRVDRADGTKSLSLGHDGDAHNAAPYQAMYVNALRWVKEP